MADLRNNRMGTSDNDDGRLHEIALILFWEFVLRPKSSSDAPVRLLNQSTEKYGKSFYPLIVYCNYFHGKEAKCALTYTTFLVCKYFHSIRAHAFHSSPSVQAKVTAASVILLTGIRT